MKPRQPPLPFGDERGHLPYRFRSWEHFHEQMADWAPQGTPPNHMIVGGMVSKRFFVMVTRFPPYYAEYVTGYYRGGMTWVPVAHSPVLAIARWNAHQWAALGKSSLRKAVWILQNQRGVPEMLIPAEARMWDALSQFEQDQVWKLIQAGAPGRISEVIVAARACGLF